MDCLDISCTRLPTVQVVARAYHSGMSRRREARAARLADLEGVDRLVVNVEDRVVVLFRHEGRIHAVDNRCPHMGFPLQRGTVAGGILTCHWHHARFDLQTGGTFDPWADDVRSFPVEVRDGEVWLDMTPPANAIQQHRHRLEEGLEHDIPLVLAKKVLSLSQAGEAPSDPFRVGLLFGCRNRMDGWGQGLTMHTCLANILPHLDPADRPRALYHGLSAVARDSAGRPPRFAMSPLPGRAPDLRLIKGWCRQFIEVRDDEGAERCIVSAARGGAGPSELADILFAAATDHRYVQVGHVADFINKAFEALDIAGWQHAEEVLSSLAHGLATAQRMEESNSWRHPVDLVAILERIEPRLGPALARGSAKHGRWTQPRTFVQGLLGDDPEAIVEQLLGALTRGGTPVQLAAAVTHAAAIRLLHFHASNEFSDWDTAFHTYSYAHAIHQGLRRTGSPALLRGVLDAAMSVYLDRFLNVPPARVTQVPPEATPDDLIAELPALLDRQQQVGPAAAAVWHYLQRGGSPEKLLATLGGMLLREDRNFHSIQVVEAAFSEYLLASDAEARAVHVTAAVRFLAAHCPTVRSQEQTFQNALRLSRGERLYEETETVVATALFADVVGSTARAAAIGDRRWRRLLEQYNIAVRTELERHGGRATEFTGDGFMSLFDGPGRAIRCARAIFDQARTLGLDMRAGVHTGECEVDGDRVRGIALHIGARVAGHAAAGEILVSGTVKDLVAGAGFALEDRGQEELKGVPGQWALYRVVV